MVASDAFGNKTGDHGGSDVEHLAAQLGRQRDALVEISLPPLTDSQVAELMRGAVALDRPVRRDFVQSLHRVTDGNAAGDDVAIAYTVTGTQHGPLMGHEPTGKTITMRSADHPGSPTGR